MLREVIRAAVAFMTTELGLEGTVVAVDKAEDGWVADVEATVIDEEMRRLAKKDLVVTWELTLSSAYEVTGFARKGMRERGSIVRSTGLMR